MYFKYTQSELNTVKSTPDNSKQIDHTFKQQPPSPKAVAKILLDLHDKEQLTINQIQDQKEVLNTLIKVCDKLYLAIYMYTHLQMYFIKYRDQCTILQKRNN